MITAERAERVAAACHRHRPYWSRAEARHALKRMKQRHQTTRFAIYACRYCGALHIGSRA